MWVAQLRSSVLLASLVSRCSRRAISFCSFSFWASKNSLSPLCFCFYGFIGRQPCLSGCAQAYSLLLTRLYSGLIKSLPGSLEEGGCCCLSSTSFSVSLLLSFLRVGCAASMGRKRYTSRDAWPS